MTYNKDADQSIAPTMMEPLRRAHRAFAEGRLGEAEFYCRLVVGADKKHFEGLHLLGLIALQKGDLDEASRLVRQALKVNPRSARAYSNLALIQQHLNRLDDALASLNRALAIEPNS